MAPKKRSNKEKPHDAIKGTSIFKSQKVKARKAIESEGLGGGIRVVSEKTARRIERRQQMQPTEIALQVCDLYLTISRH
jgi:hypothetical protein